MNTTDFLSIAWAICPERDAVVFEGKRFTYPGVNDRGNQAGPRPRDGPKKGRPRRHIQRQLQSVCGDLFCHAKMGGIFVPLNFRAKAEELEYMINRAEIKVLFVGSRYLDLVNSIRASCRSFERVIASTGGERQLRGSDRARAHRRDHGGYRGRRHDHPPLHLRHHGPAQRPFPCGTTPSSSSPSTTWSRPNPDLEERNILTVPLYHVAGFRPCFPPFTAAEPSS